MSDNRSLSEEKQETLHNLLIKHKLLFSGKLGTWKRKPVNIELQPEANPYDAKKYPVQRAHIDISKKET